VLLSRRGNTKPGEVPAFVDYWAHPGGFLQDDEPTDECVHREPFEESSMKLFYTDKGIMPEFIEQLKTYSARGRDPREFVITVAYYALVKKEKYEIKGGDDATEARWFPIDVVPELKIAFDHAQIIQDAVEKLRERIHFEPIGFHLLDKEFTMPQLQNIYIAILDPSEDDKNLRDRRNFPKKMLKLGYIKETGKKVTGNPYRSPKLYTFDEEAYAAAKKIGMRLEF
jgi:8-oxo-dGTP diphosphatase